jgi:hypothetical protein
MLVTWPVAAAASKIQPSLVSVGVYLHDRLIDTATAVCIGAKGGRSWFLTGSSPRMGEAVSVFAAHGKTPKVKVVEAGLPEDGPVLLRVDGTFPGVPWSKKDLKPGQDLNAFMVPFGRGGLQQVAVLLTGDPRAWVVEFPRTKAVLVPDGAAMLDDEDRLVGIACGRQDEPVRLVTMASLAPRLPALGLTP